MARLGGAVIVVVWGFLEMFTMGLSMVFGTLNHCDGDGVVITEQEEEVGMGVCV